MPDPLFLHAPFFLLRAPFWSLEDYENVLKEENWVEAVIHLYESKEHFREAISIASPSLYQSLQKKPYKDPKQIAASLLNYLSRMTTRSTPFGLFSFVAMGSWGETNISFDLSKVKKRARPDTAWIYNQLYRNEKQPLSFSVRSNPLTKEAGDRVFLSYFRHDKSDENEVPKSISIRANQLVRYILTIAKRPIPIPTLLEKIKEEIPSLNLEKTETLLRTLLSHQFLLPALLPSLLNTSSFSINEMLDEKILTYNTLPPGQAEATLQEIQKGMDGIISSKTFLQVDAAYEGPTPTLSKEIARELGEAAALLWKLYGTEPKFEALNAYHGKFIEKYGTDRTVPLLDLLCENRGLGSFEKTQPLIRKESKFITLWEKWLSKEWQECLHEKKQEIVITKKIVDDLYALADQEPPQPQEALLSFDVFSKVFIPENTDKSNFLLLFSSNTSQGGNTLGRFLDLFSKSTLDEVSDFFRKEELLEKDSKFFELSCWPSTAHSANVAIQPCLRSFRLDLEGDNEDSLSLRDIFVGATPNRFYLTLKEGKCELIPRMGNLLNPKLLPLPFRFMREVGNARDKILFSFTWGKLGEAATFLPRIRFQKTILSPAEWHFDAALIKDFAAWAKQWNLPRRFNLVHGDQYLLMDQEHSAHIAEITNKIKKGKSFKLVEEIDSFWIQSERGSHSSEIVATFSKNPAFSKKPIQPAPFVPIPAEHRYKLPGDEWLYVKFYLGEEESTRFLVCNLAPFAAYCEKEGKSKGWFFVRYRDPEPHLRFRLHIFSESLPEILSLLKKSSLGWIEDGLIKNMVLACYERETERYGGRELIEVAESVFCADSWSIVSILSSLLNNQFSSHESVIHTLSVIFFLRDFGLNTEDMLSILDPFQEEQSALKGFREHKNQILTLLRGDENHPEITKIRNAFQPHSPTKALFGSYTKERPFSIYRSLLHMHCNRLGCDIQAERRICLFAREILLVIQYLSAKDLDPNSRSISNHSLQTT